MPDPVTLRIFLAAVRLGSVTRAAQHCSIALSAAAKRIALLEQACGVRLLDRTPQGVRPTVAGESMASHAATLLDLSGRLMDDMRGFAAGGRGSVRLQATLSALAGHPLPQILAGFGFRHPGLRLDLREGGSVSILRDLSEGRADLGIVSGSVPAHLGLEAWPWRLDRLLVVVPADHRFAALDGVPFVAILEEPLIHATDNGALALLLEEQAGRMGRRLNGRFHVATTDASRGLVAAGHGISVMPEGVCVPYEPLLGLRCIPLKEAWAQRRLRLVGLPPDRLPAPARALRACILEAASYPAG